MEKTTGTPVSRFVQAKDSWFIIDGSDLGDRSRVGVRDRFFRFCLPIFFAIGELFHFGLK